MKLNKALKLKNKLVSEINAAMSYVKTYNSMEEGTSKAYPVKEKLEEVKSKTNELVELKTKIHIANAPVWDKIFRLSEVKSIMSNLKSLNTETKLAGGYREAVTAEITLVEKDVMMKELEAEVEALQEVLDQHNHATIIQ